MKLVDRFRNLNIGESFNVWVNRGTINITKSREQKDGKIFKTETLVEKNIKAKITREK